MSFFEVSETVKTAAQRLTIKGRIYLKYRN